MNRTPNVQISYFFTSHGHSLILCCGKYHHQAILIAEDSVVGRGGKGDNRLWKRVTPTVTEFAWLPPNIAESFCRNALYTGRLRVRIMPLTSLTWAWITPRFVTDMRVEDILFLGDTRRADDLAVFTGMAPERLCLGCGLRVEEPFAPLATGERKKLFYAAQKLLMFVLHARRSPVKKSWLRYLGFFLLYAAWVRSRAERPSVSYSKVVMEVAWTGHNLQFIWLRYLEEAKFFR